MPFSKELRVAITQSLAMKPEELLFDDVTAALDPETGKEVLATIKDLAAEDITCILVTHADLEEKHELRDGTPAGQINNPREKYFDRLENKSSKLIHP